MSALHPKKRRIRIPRSPLEGLLPTRYRAYGLNLVTDFRFANRLISVSAETASNGRGGDVPTRLDIPDLTFVCQRKPPLSFDAAAATPAYTSPFRDEHGEPTATMFRLDDCDVMHYPRSVQFFLHPERITAYLLNRDHRYAVEIYLLGSVLSLFLERSGIPMLHASAVTVDDHAIAFLSSNRGGKSGLAAALMQDGYPLITDDILPIESVDGRFFSHPGYPTMRMWPDEAEYFLGSYEALALVHPELSKRRVPVGPSGFGTFCTESLPLKTIYLPERREPSEWGDSIEVESVTPANAVIELVRNSFVARTVQALGWQPRRLALFAELAQQIPMRRLIYPSGFEHLPRAREAILADGVRT